MANLSFVLLEVFGFFFILDIFDQHFIHFVGVEPTDKGDQL